MHQKSFFTFCKQEEGEWVHNRDGNFSSLRCTSSYKDKSIHAFDKSQAFIFFNMYSFVYLCIVFILISSNDFVPEVIFDYAENARMRKMKG